MSQTKRRNIGIVTFPIMESGVTPLSHLIAVLTHLSPQIQVISGNAASGLVGRKTGAQFHLIDHIPGKNPFSRIFRFVITQAKIARIVARQSRDVDVWFFFLGEGGLALPMLAARVVGRRKVVLVSASSNRSMFHASGDSLSWPIRLLERFNRTLASGVVIYSPNMVNEWGLQRYMTKIFVAHEHFVDFENFKPQKRLDQRGQVIGFIGRFSKEKGILNFVEALPKLAQAHEDLHFLIAGDGPLRPEVEAYLDRADLDGRIAITGWISREELPNYLNELKLLIVPSYTEGLANIVLEAMACGTPVLATPVGALRDLVRDKTTGFVLGDNSPESIPDSVLKALAFPHTDRIVESAWTMVRKEFTLEAAIQGFQSILQEMYPDEAVDISDANSAPEGP